MARNTAASVHRQGVASDRFAEMPPATIARRTSVKPGLSQPIKVTGQPPMAAEPCCLRVPPDNDGSHSASPGRPTYPAALSMPGGTAFASHLADAVAVSFLTL